jgi:hypothetical protein
MAADEGVAYQKYRFPFIGLTVSGVEVREVSLAGGWDVCISL